jgi:hypothetical protein
MITSIPSTTLENFTTFGDLLRFLRRRAGRPACGVLCHDLLHGMICYEMLSISKITYRAVSKSSAGSQGGSELSYQGIVFKSFLPLIYMGANVL